MANDLDERDQLDRQVPLHVGTNQFTVAGVDIHGQPIAGHTDTVTAVYDGSRALARRGRW